LTHEELLLFGERLRSRRNALGFTQEFVSEKAGISLRFYQMLERGEKSVSLDTLLKLSKTLTISTDYLLLGDEECSDVTGITAQLNRIPHEHMKTVEGILNCYIEGIAIEQHSKGTD